MKTERLIKRCIKGERKSQKQFYETYCDVLYAVVLRYCNNKEESEDVLLQAFLKIFEALQHLRYINEMAFIGWLKKIVINEALLEKRKKLRQLYKVEFDNDCNNISYANADDYSEDELIEFVNRLPEGYRTVFLMYVVDGYSHKEIAIALDISENTSRSQFFKARKLLRKIITGDNERKSGT